MSQLQELHTQKQHVLFICFLHHGTAIFIAHFHKCVFCKNQREQGKIFIISIHLFWHICMPLKHKSLEFLLNAPSGTLFHTNQIFLSSEGACCLDVDNLIAPTQLYTVLPKNTILYPWPQFNLSCFYQVNVAERKKTKNKT